MCVVCFFGFFLGGGEVMDVFPKQGYLAPMLRFSAGHNAVPFDALLEPKDKFGRCIWLAHKYF